MTTFQFDDADRAPSRAGSGWKRDEAAALRGVRERRLDVIGDRGILRLQRSAGNAAVSELTEERSPVLDVISSDGAPLERGLRGEMESRLGADFADVRVHTGADAHDSARSVGAQAYTVGSNVVFQRDAWEPGSTAGRTTLAHELTHVMQQRSGPVDGTPAGGGVSVSDPGDRFERSAVENAERVMSVQRIEHEADLDEDDAHVQRSSSATDERSVPAGAAAPPPDLVVQRAKGVPVPALNREGEFGSQVWFSPFAWMTGHETPVDMSDISGQMDVAPGVDHGIISVGIVSGYWTPHDGGEAARGSSSMSFRTADDGRLAITPPTTGMGFALPQHQSTIDAPTVERSIAGDFDTATIRFGFKWHRDPDQIQSQSGSTTSSESSRTSGSSSTAGTAVTVGGKTGEEGSLGPAKVSSEQNASATVTGTSTSSTENTSKTGSSTTTSTNIVRPGAITGDGLYSFSLVIRSKLRTPIRHVEVARFALDKAIVLNEQTVVDIATGTFLSDRDDQINFRDRLRRGEDEIILRGFASTQGKPQLRDYNRDLSQRRCEAVARLLRGKGALKAVVADIVPIGEDQAIRDKQVDNPEYQKVEIIVRARVSRP